MLGIVFHLPPVIEHYVMVTPIEVMAAHALLAVGWFPIFGVLVWGMSHVWLDFKQEKYEHGLKFVLLEVRVPQMAIQTPKGMDVFFSNLAGFRSSITWREKWLLGKSQPVLSFEIVSNSGQVQFLIRCIDRQRDLVEADLYAQYPEAQITEIEDYTHNIAHSYPNDEWEAFGAEFILKNKEYLPIRTYEDFEHQGEKDSRFKDPLLPILEIMGKMQQGENFWMQILIQQPDDQNWTKEGAKYAGKVMGKEEKHVKTMFEEFTETAIQFPQEILGQLTGIGGAGAHAAEKKADDFRVFKLTPAEKIQIEAVTDKISKLGWYTKIRVVYSAKKNKFRKGMMAAAMKGMMASYGNSVVNQFGMHNASIPKDDYFWMEWSYAAKQTTIVNRYAHRSMHAGATHFILNTEELATLWHFPAADARTPVLSALGARRAEAPAGLSFADDLDGDGIPDWKQQHGKSLPGAAEDESEDVQLPSPASPTATPGEAPVAGRPAPLPPGLDLHDEPADPHAAAPGNLPV
ncbi:MAG: hypothetical protein QG626_868 [Patescibacteria group bacterium]|jgi:hypothetical protein|nr:hypothetical protein [Patescibacteria group bacterium]